LGDGIIATSRTCRRAADAARRTSTDGAAAVSVAFRSSLTSISIVHDVFGSCPSARLRRWGVADKLADTPGPAVPNAEALMLFIRHEQHPGVPAGILRELVGDVLPATAAAVRGGGDGVIQSKTINVSILSFCA